MDEARRECVRSWLAKARNGLRAARILAASGESLNDTAVHHCQQAAEKSLKGYLTSRDQPLERTHDLERLVELTLPLDGTFASLMSRAVSLNPYATTFRYPDLIGSQLPSVEEEVVAVGHAQEVYAFVLQHVPEDSHPS